MLSDRYTTGDPSDRYHTEPDYTRPSRAEAERDERETSRRVLRVGESGPFPQAPAIVTEDFDPSNDRKEW